METNLQWKNLKALVETPRQHEISSGRVRMDYIWGSSIVETCLRIMIDLWELRNEEVHRKKEVTKQQKKEIQSSYQCVSLKQA